MYTGSFIPQILIQHLPFVKHCVNSGNAGMNKTHYLPIEF